MQEELPNLKTNANFHTEEIKKNICTFGRYAKLKGLVQIPKFNKNIFKRLPIVSQSDSHVSQSVVPKRDKVTYKIIFELLTSQKMFPLCRAGRAEPERAKILRISIKSNL